MGYRSGYDRLIAHRLPLRDQVPFFGTTGRLSSGAIVSMKVGGAVLDDIIQPNMPFEPLVQVASLRNVDRDPSPILGLLRIDVIAGQRLEGSIKRMDFVLILLSGLPRPTNQCRRDFLGMPVMTE